MAEIGDFQFVLVLICIGLAVFIGFEIYEQQRNMIVQSGKWCTAHFGVGNWKYVDVGGGDTCGKLWGQCWVCVESDKNG